MGSDVRLERLQRDPARLGDPSRAGDRERERGREADHPGEIQPPGWKDILWPYGQRCQIKTRFF